MKQTMQMQDHISASQRTGKTDDLEILLNATKGIFNGVKAAFSAIFDKPTAIDGAIKTLKPLPKFKGK